MVLPTFKMSLPSRLTWCGNSYTDVHSLESLDHAQAGCHPDQ
ncbi:hypothetical protein LEMLEM_LOCUS13220 [Lemmus lemmus]